MGKQMKLIAVPIPHGSLMGTDHRSDEEMWGVKIDIPREKNLAALEEAINDGWEITQADSVVKLGTAVIMYMLFKEDKVEED